RVERLALRRRQPRDRAPLALRLVDRRRVDGDRRGRLETALEAVEPRRDQAAEREVRVARRVAGLELDVRRRLLGAAKRRGHPHRRLTVVNPQQTKAPAQYCGTIRW